MREILEARLAELKSQLEQIKQQYIATAGAVVELERLLQPSTSPEVEKE